MAIYTGYFDESGDEEQPHFAIGGIILDAEKAASFDRDWREAIKDLPSYDGDPFLHTADFLSAKEQYFPEWKGRYEEKLAILSNAAHVISHYSLQVVTSMINLNDYCDFDSIIKMSEAIGHPYTVALKICYETMQRWANKNSVATPIKMIVEQRKGLGDAIDMFTYAGLPAPSPEPKGSPALQAADYIAWMRFNREYRSYSYEQVKGSWKEINKSFYEDYTFGSYELLVALDRLLAQPQISGVSFPRREHDSIVTIKNNLKKPRRPFQWKSKRAKEIQASKDDSRE